jgi:hypothetical protein
MIQASFPGVFRSRHLTALLVLLLPLSLCRADAPANAKAAKPTTDRWSTYRIGGQPVGYIRTTCETDNHDQTISRIQMRIIINRLGNKVEIIASSIYEESAEGLLRKASSEASTSRQKSTVEAEIAPAHVTLHSRAGNRDYERSLPYTGTLLGPEAARRLSASKLRKAGDRVEYQTFSPELQAISKITNTVLASETIELAGAKVAAIKIEQTIEGYPAKRTVWLDGDGFELRQTEPGPFGVTEVVRANRAEALAAAGGGELHGEMFDQTLVRSNIRLPSPRTISRLRCELTQKDKSLGWPEFAGPGQTVLRQDPGSLILEIRQPEPAPAARRPATDTPELHNYLAANSILQSDDAEVRRIAREVVGDEMDTSAAARKLRDWVSQNMRFDLGIAVAPASEVVRNRGGTCMAYSVLLASLLRAEGIPSRIVMGFVYIAGVWGGHAWVEYRAADRWVPIDAAVPSPEGCDAARLVCVRNSLSSGIAPILGSLLQLYGNVDVRVTAFEIDGKTTEVPAAAKPFAVEGDTYRNAYLGIQLTKPAAFRFVKMDRVYPETTIVELAGPHGEVIRLAQEHLGPAAKRAGVALNHLRDCKLEGAAKTLAFAGCEAVRIDNARKAGLAIVDRTDVWVLTVEADDAATLLDTIAAGLKLSH